MGTDPWSGCRRSGDAREALIAPEAVRTTFFTYQRLVQILHSAGKPDPLAQEFNAPSPPWPSSSPPSARRSPPSGPISVP
ncbi:MAG: hypothetical protein WAM11_10875 [Cyanobium sp.]